MFSHLYFLLFSYVKGGEAIRVEMKQKAAMNMLPPSLQLEEVKPHLNLKVNLSASKLGSRGGYNPDEDMNDTDENEGVVNAWRSNAQAALDAAVGQSGIMLSDMHELTEHYIALYNSFGTRTHGITKEEYSFWTSYRLRCSLPSDISSAKKESGWYVWNVVDGIKFSREMQCDNQHTWALNPIHWSPNRVVLVSRVPTTNESALGDNASSADYLECAMIFLGTKTREHIKNDMNFKRVHEWAGYNTPRNGGFHRGFVKQMDGYFNDKCFKAMVRRALLGNPERKRCGRIISMGHSLGGSVASLYAAAANGMAEYVQLRRDVEDSLAKSRVARLRKLKETWRLDARGAEQTVMTTNRYRKMGQALEIFYEDVFPVDDLITEKIPFPNVEIYAQAAPPITFVDPNSAPGGGGTSPLMNRHPNAKNGAFKGLRLNAAKETLTCSNFMKILWFGLAHKKTAHDSFWSFIKGDPGEDGQAGMSGAKVPMLTIPNTFATSESVWRLLNPFFLLKKADPGQRTTKEQFQAAAGQILAHPYDYAVAYTAVNGNTISTVSLDADNGWQWSMFDGRSPGLLPVCSETTLPGGFRAIHNRYPYGSVLGYVAASFASFTYQQLIHVNSRDLALQSRDSGICDGESCGSPRVQLVAKPESTFPGPDDENFTIKAFPV